MPRRVVIGEDDVLMRDGIARLLTDAGFEVVAQAGDADDLLRKGLAHRPDLLIADINMLPDYSDDGLRAALDVRGRHPQTGVQFIPSTTTGATRSTSSLTAPMASVTCSKSA